MNSSSVNHSVASDQTDSARRDVIDAGIRCFKQFGAKRTSMADIAEEAGISRKTLYRLFDDRMDLVEQILLRLFGNIERSVIKRVKAMDSVETAIVEGTIISVRSARANVVFKEIIDQNDRFEEILFHGNAVVRDYLYGFWGGVIQRGKDEGSIRESLSNERALELFMSCHAILLAQNDLDVDQARNFVRDLYWAAITNKTFE